MKLTAPSIDKIVEDSHDRFDRDSFGRGLLRLFRESETPLVVALDGSWGTGKTVFARRLSRAAKELGYSTVYFDAFSKDYDPDVFVSLSAAAIAEMPKSDNKTELSKQAKAVGKILGRVALKGGIRLASAGALRLSDLSESVEEVAENALNLFESELDKIIDERLTSAQKDILAFSKFRDILSSLAVGIYGDNEYRPTVFIIDELDRCRPDFALHVLEIIKHFFSVPSVHFLVLCDFEQLTSSVRHRYGNTVNADEYLEKFINARVSLPVPEEYKRRKQVTEFVTDLLNSFPNDGEAGNYKRGMTEFLVELAIYRNYSLRRIERVLTQFGICLAFTESKTLRLGAVVFILCDLKITQRNLFEKAKRGRLKYAEIAKIYPLNEDRYEWFNKWLRYFYDETVDHSDDEWKNMSRSLHNYSIRSIKDTAIYLANNVVDNISA